MPATRRRIRPETEEVRGRVAWQVMLHLLRTRQVVVSARDLARQLDAGHSQVANAVSFLVFHRALREGESGLVVEWDQLARIVGALRLPSIMPERTFDAVLSQEDARAEFERREIRHAFAFTTAANILAYFEPHPEVCILVERRDLAAAARVFSEAAAGLVTPRSRSPVADPRSASSRFMLFPDRIQRLDVTDSDQGRVTSLHQTYVDLLYFPLAGAHADFLKKAIDKRWQRERSDDDATSRRTT